MSERFSLGDYSGALVVASSDMSHYVPAETAREKDHRAIARILALDPRGLYDVVRRERITMCGIVPATVMLVAAKALGATQAELVRYANSGDVNGDTRQVVVPVNPKEWKKGRTPTKPSARFKPKICSSCSMFEPML